MADSLIPDRQLGESERIDRFRAEIASMRSSDPVTAREKLLARAGGGLMVVGLAIGVVAFALSQGTNLVLDQNDDIILALIATSVVIAGAAVFLRYSLGGFLRFWLARLIYEQRMQADRGPRLGDEGPVAQPGEPSRDVVGVAGAPTDSSPGHRPLG
jgi:hypothetical protein